MTYTDWIKAVAAHLLEMGATFYSEEEARRAYSAGQSPAVAAQLCQIEDEVLLARRLK
jgi:hypothetical protein